MLTHRILVAASLLLAGWPPAHGNGQNSPVRERTAYEDLQMFSQVLNQIRVNHPDTVNPHDLFMAAIEGMVRAADPHSFVIPAARLAPEKEAAYRAGDLVPVPLAFRYVGGAPVVAGVAAGSRAVSTGILPGDELVGIDGDDVKARTALELEVTLAGEPGTAVQLSFVRRRLDGRLVRIERSVFRERVEPESAVPVAIMLDSATGYVRVTTFAAERVQRDLNDALEELEGQGMRGLVLDLRDNGGGLLDEAAAVAGAFLPRGAVVYTTSGRKREVVDTVRVRRAFWRQGRDIPVVLLVNEGTASASELVAGALQDHDRALVVGQTTFGKALMLQPFPLTDGSVMMLVIGKVHTPCGRVVQREYREITSREYYRAAAEQRSLAGRDTCTTAAGRTVYGGGGISPDHVLPSRPVPVWLDEIHHEDLMTRWLPGLLDARNAQDSPDTALALDSDELTRFTAFAAEQGVEIPDDPDAHALLQHVLASRLALLKHGPTPHYTYLALNDPDVAAAATFVHDARSLIAPARPNQ